MTREEQNEVTDKLDGGGAMNRVVWHYTYSHNIDAILDSRQLVPPCLSGLAMAYDNTPLANHPQTKADAKMLLFSENAVWEPASYRGIVQDGRVVDLHNREDYARVGLGIFRIGVNAGVLTPYAMLTRRAGVSNKMDRSLRQTARDIGGDPNQWWGTLKPVPVKQWVAFEVLVGDDWVDALAHMDAAAMAAKAGL